MYINIYFSLLIINTLTKQKHTKMPIGIVDRPSSHLQPRVGIIHRAKRTSNTAPMAQKA